MNNDEQPIKIGVLWWCGDDECDCYEYKILKATPGSKPFTYLPSTAEVIWKGTFWSNGLGYITQEERADIERQYRSALRALGAEDWTDKVGGI